MINISKATRYVGSSGSKADVLSREIITGTKPRRLCGKMEGEIIPRIKDVVYQKKTYYLLVLCHRRMENAADIYSKIYER